MRQYSKFLQCLCIAFVLHYAFVYLFIILFLNHYHISIHYCLLWACYKYWHFQLFNCVYPSLNRRELNYNHSWSNHFCSVNLHALLYVGVGVVGQCVCQGSWQYLHLLAASGPSWQGRQKLCDALVRVQRRLQPQHVNMAATLRLLLHSVCISILLWK